MKSLLIFMFCKVLLSLAQEEEILRPTFTQHELENFCNDRHSASTQPGKTKGYIHPYYCARYIECSITNLEDGKQTIKSQEKICGRCSNENLKTLIKSGKSKKRACLFGHDHWDEEAQSCQPQNQKCIQAELPKNNTWGRKDRAHLCLDVKAGTTQIFPHPNHCGKYVSCHRDRDYFRDLWVTVEMCPLCDQKDSGCPNGYMYYYPPINETAGLCHLLHDIPEGSRCDPPALPTERPTAPLITTTSTPTDVKDNIAKENIIDAAKAFCNTTQPFTKRYAVPGVCNQYYFCWADLFDRDGDMKPLDKVHHFQFSCQTCTEARVDADVCVPTTDGANNYLMFDMDQQECVLPTNGSCKADGSFAVDQSAVAELKRLEDLIPAWRKKLMTQEEVIAYCKEQNGTNGNFIHPKDKTCSRFVECWPQQESYREKSCPECHHSFKWSKSKCPFGHLYFDKGSGTCQVGSPSGCEAEKEDTNQTPSPIDPVLMWSTTPNPDEEIEEENTEEETHPELMESRKCNLKNYVQRGYCKSYFTCDRKTQMEKLHTCSGRLYWNSDSNTIHGGVCDFLRNIDNFTLYQYKKDPGCPLHISYFRTDEKECSGTYYYHHPKRTEGKEVKLSCPEDLLWSKEAKTCVKCHSAMMKDGLTPCCDPPDTEDDTKE